MNTDKQKSLEINFQARIEILFRKLIQLIKLSQFLRSPGWKNQHARIKQKNSSSAAWQSSSFS